MRNRLQIVSGAALFGVAVLAACGGGGGGGGSVPHSGPQGPTVQAHLTITVPSRSASGHWRRPNTVSPLTQSVGIVVNAGAAQIFNTTPSGPNCTSGQTGTTCAFTVLAPVGSDTFAITTYDGPNANGNALNGCVCVASISPNATNNVSAILTMDFVSNLNDSGNNSLRAVIAAASSNDTICFTQAGTIHFGSPVALTQNVTIDGTCQSSVTFDGGGAQQLLTISSGTNVTLKGLAFQNGHVAGGNGGAINNAGTLALVSDLFTLNTGAGPAEGGAVYSTGPLSITNSTFDNNSVSFAVGPSPGCAITTYLRGGAVYVVAPNTLTVVNSTFTNNKTIYTQASGCGTVTGGAIGGAIVAEASFSITGSTFRSNSAAAYGGALAGPEVALTPVPYNATISGSTFDSNTAVQYAGAWSYDTGTTTVSSTTFSNNTAGSNCCGAVGEFSGASPAPGAQYTASFTNDTFSGNVAARGSGAMEQDTPHTLISGSQFLNNRAGADSGAMELDYAPLLITNDLFQGNQATSDGGVFEVDDCPGISFVNNTFNHNSAGTDGGAMEVDCATTITGGTFSNNTAPAGGALTLFDTTTINGATFTGNSATGSVATHGGAGGAIYLDTDSTLSNVTMNANTATELGGGIYTTCQLTMAGSTLSGNQVTGTAATDGGGGIYAYQVGNNTYCHPVVNITNSTIANNVSASAGGGIWNSSMTMTLNFATIASNTAGGAGWNIDNAVGPGGITINSAARRTASRGRHRESAVRVPMAGATPPPPPTTTISNSIVYAANAHAGSDINNTATLYGSDNNVFFNVFPIGGTGFADSPVNNVTTDPILGPLRSNGGSTSTMALGSGSSAIGHVPSCSAVTTDQRGNSRPAMNCDSGAYQHP